MDLSTKEKMIVYIVDDDNDDLEIFTEILSEIDDSIKCISFVNGREALNLLMEEGIILPDFIFVDLNMPVMNGFEFLKAIKKHDNLVGLPVIIYTTSSEQKHKDEVKRLGASSFITKPSDLHELKRELDKVITGA